MTAFAAATVASAGAVVGAPIAIADDGELATHEIGEQARLNDGSVVQGWTITDLKASTDTIPYDVQGTLWEATATDEAIQGTATPIVSNLNARTSDGETYRALFQVASPEGVNPATLPQGEKTTGKVYFDVTGPEPESVVYNAGGRDLLVWEQVQPSAGEAQTPAASGPSSAQTPAAPSGAEQATTAPEEMPEEPTAPGAAEEPTAPGAAEEASPAPAGSEGTPLTDDSAPESVPAGRSGTPLPAGTEGTPRPAAANEGTQSPTGSQGTPLPATSHGPAPAVSHGTPTP